MIVLDTETTGLIVPTVSGLDKQPKIIDFAAVQLDPRSGEEVNRIEFLLNPGCALSDEITKITGYRDADLIGAPAFAEVWMDLAEFFLGETSLLAHNLPFDKAMVLYELQRIGMEHSFPWPMRQICTVQLYEQEFGKYPKLTALYEAKLGRKLEQKHTAMADVEALVEIVQRERLYELG